MRKTLESEEGDNYPIIESNKPIIENSHERRVRSPMVQSHGTYG